MRKYFLLMIFVSAAFLMYAADTVSYKLGRIENWVFYGTSYPVAELVVANGSGVQKAIDLSCEVLDCNGSSLYELRQKSILSAYDSVSLAFSFKTLVPGFYTAVFRDGGKVVNSFNMAYEPDKIKSDVILLHSDSDLQGDFSGIIESVLRGKSSRPGGVSVVRNKKLSGKEKNVYDFKFFSADGEPVNGFLALPKGKKGLQAMVTLVAEEDKKENPLAEFTANKDMVELLLYIKGRGEGKEYFKNVFTDILLATEYLAQRKEVDPASIYTQGNGICGAFSSLSSALCKGVAISFATSPDYSRFVEHFTVESLVCNVSSRVLVGYGLQEDAKQLQRNFAIYNNIPASKEYFVFPDSNSVERNKWRYIRDTFIKRAAQD